MQHPHTYAAEIWEPKKDNATGNEEMPTRAKRKAEEKHRKEAQIYMRFASIESKNKPKAKVMKS